MQHTEYGITLTIGFEFAHMLVINGVFSPFHPRLGLLFLEMKDEHSFLLLLLLLLLLLVVLIFLFLLGLGETASGGGHLVYRIFCNVVV